MYRHTYRGRAQVIRQCMCSKYIYICTWNGLIKQFFFVSGNHKNVLGKVILIYKLISQLDQKNLCKLSDYCEIIIMNN